MFALGIASSSRQPRSIYGKIVAEADRDIDVHEIFLRAIEYGKENYPEKDKEEQWKRFSDHMDEKYSRNGYIKLWIPNSPNEKALKELRNIIDNKAELRKHFEEIYEEMGKKSLDLGEKESWHKRKGRNRSLNLRERRFFKKNRLKDLVVSKDYIIFAT